MMGTSDAMANGIAHVLRAKLLCVWKGRAQKGFTAGGGCVIEYGYLPRLKRKSQSMENAMKTLWIGVAVMCAALIGLPGPAHAQSEQVQPIPGVKPATDFPNENELPDLNLVYKVAFDIAKASPKIDEQNPGLLKIAEYYNTLAKHGVPADHIKFIVVFHQKGAEFALNNAVYKARNDGHDNPNIALIQNMKKAGVDLRVCGQGVLGMKVDRSAILPEVQVDLWALVTLTTMALKGYTRVNIG
jgi:intracellular sulfur oxidation DsrE/DsrF family protein